MGTFVPYVEARQEVALSLAMLLLRQPGGGVAVETQLFAHQKRICRRIIGDDLIAGCLQILASAFCPLACVCSCAPRAASNRQKP